MTPRTLRLVLLLGLGFPSIARADKDNAFSGSVFLGDAYAPNNFRLSIKSVDVGFSDMAGLYAGSRAWLGNYHAGFGLSARQFMYGLVGYEWRFLSWLGLSAEFDGLMSVRGEAMGRVYIGVVAGW